jgi:type I restriction-modification system DNA methylase subunit
LIYLPSFETDLSKQKNIANFQSQAELILHAVKCIVATLQPSKKSAIENELAVLFFIIHVIQKKHLGKIVFAFPTELEGHQIPDQKFLKRQLQVVLQIDWPNTQMDLLGSVYNKIASQLPENQHGQHFTDVDEVDIICAFCLHAKAKSILDSAAGAGAFLMRAQNALPKANMYAVEIDAVVAQLARLNMHWNKKSTMEILLNDFVNVQQKDLPMMDAIIGNPPYIRQEEMPNKTQWKKLLKTNWGIAKMNAQCDFYVYYLMHTASFLKEGGRLGYVLSTSWLDNAFGAALQQFLLQHFKIIAIIDQQAERSFETASVNSIILIVERCSNAQQREAHAAQFVRLKKAYTFFMDRLHAPTRKQKLKDFVQKIENALPKQTEGIKTFSITQKDLWQASWMDNKFENGNWGAKYLRSPNIYQDILQKGATHFLPLQKIATVRYGIKTGANDFFYLQDRTSEAFVLDEKIYKARFGKAKAAHKTFWQKHGRYHSSLVDDFVIIERKYVQPVFKSQRDAKTLLVQPNELPFVMLTCSASKAELAKSKSPLLNYIHLAEKKYKVHEVASVQGRKHWYDLSASLHVGDFIFPSKIGDRYRLMDNRQAQVFCDKVNYVIELHPAFQKQADIIFLLLNSICFRFFVELFARQLTGNQTLSDVDVQVVAKTLVPNPKLFVGKQKQMHALMRKLQSRPQLSIFDEVKMQDRLALEKLIFETIGLGENEMKALLKAAVDYVQQRNDKSASLKKGM